MVLPTIEWPQEKICLRCKKKFTKQMFFENTRAQEHTWKQKIFCSRTCGSMYWQENKK